MKPIVVDKTATETTVVDSGNTAASVGSGLLPVFSTPMMIALMEKAACNCLSDCMDSGETSVGTVVNIEHISASKVGVKIVATAVVTAVDGRKVDFDVVAVEEGGKKIGMGKHTRFVVDEARFMSKL